MKSAPRYRNVLRKARKDTALSPVAKVVLAELAELCQMREGVCFASDDHLATECGTAVRNVQRALRDLESREFIERDGATRTRRIRVKQDSEIPATSATGGENDSRHFRQTGGAIPANGGGSPQRDINPPSGGESAPAGTRTREGSSLAAASRRRPVRRAETTSPPQTPNAPPPPPSPQGPWTPAQDHAEHPAVRAYIQATGKRPTDRFCGKIIARVGQDADALDEWRSQLWRWKESNYEMLNIDGLLHAFESARNGTTSAPGLNRGYTARPFNDRGPSAPAPRPFTPRYATD